MIPAIRGRAVKRRVAAGGLITPVHALHNISGQEAASGSWAEILASRWTPDVGTIMSGNGFLISGSGDAQIEILVRTNSSTNSRIARWKLGNRNILDTNPNINPTVPWSDSTLASNNPFTVIYNYLPLLNGDVVVPEFRNNGSISTQRTFANQEVWIRPMSEAVWTLSRTIKSSAQTVNLNEWTKVGGWAVDPAISGSSHFRGTFVENDGLKMPAPKTGAVITAQVNYGYEYGQHQLRISVNGTVVATGALNNYPSVGAGNAGNRVNATWTGDLNRGDIVTTELWTDSNFSGANNINTGSNTFLQVV